MSITTAKGKAGAKALKKAPKKTGTAAKKGAVKKSQPTKTAPIKNAATKKVAPERKVQAKKPVGKSAAKGAVKKAVKPSVKTAPKPSTKKRPAKAPAPATAKRAATPAKSATLSHTSTLAKKPPAAVGGTALAAPKSGPQTIASPPPAPRPVRTSRLQQLTVPGMAQSIASTAAKSSYSQLPALPVAPAPVYVAAKKDPKLANNWKRKTLEELTDPDVLAMPDSEYMSSLQLVFFRRKLVQLRSEMLSNAGETTEHLREDTVIVPDPADRATIEEEHALELRTRDRERKLLKKVEQSINRIDSGDYGYCDETGEAIGVGRLLARPTASLSLEAQQRRELKQKMFGD